MFIVCLRSVLQSRSFCAAAAARWPIDVSPLPGLSSPSENIIFMQISLIRKLQTIKTTNIWKIADKWQLFAKCPGKSRYISSGFAILVLLFFLYIWRENHYLSCSKIQKRTFNSRNHYFLFWNDFDSYAYHLTTSTIVAKKIANKKKYLKLFGDLRLVGERAVLLEVIPHATNRKCTVVQLRKLNKSNF